MYSAVKKDGVPLHKLAREGQEVEREPKTVTIHRLELLRLKLPEAEIAVDCTAGTYVRTLAGDIGTNGNQLAQHRTLAHDIGIGHNIRRCRCFFGQTAQIGQTTRIIELPVLVQPLG